MISLGNGLAEVLGAHLGHPVGIDGLRPLSGGSSHETWGFELADGNTVIPLILRREVERGMLDPDVGSEYQLLCALHDAGVPVPRPWLCAVADSPLGLPFMIMERVLGTDLRKDLARTEHGRDLASLAAAAVALQAQLHEVEAARLPGLEQDFGPAHEVDRWSAVIDAAVLDPRLPRPHPLLATALTWLRVVAPEPGPAHLVHGDFKANNLLISPAGALTVIDWELAHLGDPVEDLAWTMLWRTGWDVVGGLHTEAGYVEAYTHLTGRQVNPERLHFWRVFSLVKLWAIFLTGMSGEAPRPTLRLMGRATVWLADQLAQELALVSAT